MLRAIKYKLISKVLVFAVLAVSCTVQRDIKIDVLKPASINIPDKYSNVLLVNNTKLQPSATGNYYLQKDLSSSWRVKSTKTYAREDTLKLDSIGFSCIYNTANNLLKSEFLDTAVVWPNNVSVPTRPWTSQMLLPGVVKVLAETTGADLIASLDLLKYETYISYSAWYDEVYDLTAETRLEALWRFYDGETMELIKSKNLKDTLYYDVFGDDVSEPGYLEVIVNQSAWELGEKSAQQMFPYWKTVNRVYFKSGTPGLRLGDRYYENKRYDEAFLVWQKEYETSRNKGKARAAFNMALVKEITGDLNKALEYLTLAKMVYDDSNVLLKSSPEYKLIKSYTEVIEKRIEEEEKLLEVL